MNIGIIGCGSIARWRHMTEYDMIPDVKMTGFFDLNKERAEESAKKYGGKAYDSLEELLADESIDAVSVCTANFDHCKSTVSALRAGKHVLCEKPMAVNMEECSLMVEEAKKAGKTLMIAHNQRYMAEHMLARKLVEEGSIGRILTFRTVFGHGGPEGWSIDPGSGVWFFDKSRAAFGAMADLGIHKTDLIQYLTGQRIASVSASLGTLHKTGNDGEKISVDDNAVCIYTMEDGSFGTMTASWTYYEGEDNSTVLYGTEGMLRILCGPEYGVELVLRDGTKKTFLPKATEEGYVSSGVMTEFVSCLRDGRTPALSGENILHAMKAVFAAMESHKTGKRIDIL